MHHLLHPADLSSWLLAAILRTHFSQAQNEEQVPSWELSPGKVQRLHAYPTPETTAEGKSFWEEIRTGCDIGEEFIAV